MADEGELNQSQSSCREAESHFDLQLEVDDHKTQLINRTEDSDGGGGQLIESAGSSIQITNNDIDAGSTQTSKSVPTTENPFEKANRYLYNHNLFCFFQELVMNVAHKQPSDSISFMVSEIEKYRDQL